MPDENVAVADEAESPTEATEAPEATPASDELATLKKRLAGKDQALTRTAQERDALKAEREALVKWKAEREEADLTEVEKLQRRLAEFEERATKAEQAAERVRLASTYPLAVEAFGDDPLPSEDRLAVIQERLAAAAATEGDDEEPRIDPNRPRRAPATGGKPIEQMNSAELKAHLASLKGVTSLEDVRGW